MESVIQIFHVPLRDPVIVIALAMIVFLVAPLLFERLRLPSTVAFIAAGAVLGPNGLGWMARDETIVLLGTVGLLYLMFMAAVEIDLHDFHPIGTAAEAGRRTNGWLLPLLATRYSLLATRY